MGRRGRPPYPDILTPRQWEVLDLVRRGLADQQIADALDLTLAGAKYHVSEILTKLGVESREEAAAWQPSDVRVPWWRRALALSLAVKIAGTAVVIAAAAGIGVLAWGALRSDDSGNVSTAAVFDDLALPSPLTLPNLSREQAVAEAGETFEMGDVRAIDLEATTIDGINLYDSHFHLDPSTATAWLVRARSYATQSEGNPGGPAFPSPDITACRELVAAVVETVVAAGPGAGPPRPDQDCSGDFTSALAIFVAARILGTDLKHEVPSHVGVEKLAKADAIANMQTLLGGSFDQSGVSDQDVWLVTFDSQCTVAAAIVGEPNVVLAKGSARTSGC